MRPSLRLAAFASFLGIALCFFGLAYRFDHHNSPFVLTGNGSFVEVMELRVDGKEIENAHIAVQPSTSQIGKFLIYRYPKQFILLSHHAGQEFRTSVKEATFENLRIGDTIAIAGDSEAGVVRLEEPVLADFKGPVFGLKLSYSQDELNRGYSLLMRYFQSLNPKATPQGTPARPHNLGP